MAESGLMGCYGSGLVLCSASHAATKRHVCL